VSGSDEEREELRLALAMRGGVSLAVWIGGAVAEIDRLRRASHRTSHDGESDPAQVAAARRFWTRLLDAAGFGRVLVDVISGASAGGLNGVLYATALRSGRPVDPLRDVWLDKGSMVKLLGAEAPTKRRERVASWLLGPPAPKRNSVLDGNYFLEELGIAVAGLANSGEGSMVQEHPMSLFLAATILGGALRTSHDDPWSTQTGTSSDALFHFRHAGEGPELSDFGPEESLTRRLARSARTTSSFPIAFEPVQWTPALGGGVLQGPPGFLDANPDLIDGGVVDNIPVARAIDQIARSQAATSSTRWLLYLQPSPGLPDAAAPKNSPGHLPPGLLKVIGKLTGVLRSESVLDDLDVLDLHNERARLVSKTREAAILSEVGYEPTATTPDAPTDSAHLYALLIAPGREVAWVPIGGTLPPGPLHDLDPDARRQIRRTIENKVADCYGAAPTAGRVGPTLPSLGARSVRPFMAVMRTAVLIVDWMKDVEGRQVKMKPATSNVIAQSKSEAYAVYRIAEQLQAFLDRAALAETPMTPGDAVGWISDLEDRSLATRSNPRVVELATAGTDPWTDAEGSLGRTLRAVATDTLPCLQSREPAGDALTALWDRLVGAAAEAAAALRDDKNPAVLSSDAAWPRFLQDAPDATDMARLLDRIDRATLGLHAGGPGESLTEIRYVRVSGANITPLALANWPIREGVEFTAPSPNLLPTGANWLIDDASAMDSRRKLAGDEVANFTAFISKRWRRNDWMWGQLDAAKSLLDVVLDPERLIRVTVRGGVTEEDAAKKLLTAVEAAVTQGADADSHVKRLWDENLMSVRDEIEALFKDRYTDPDALQLTKLVLLCRRHWDLLTAELPAVLATPLRDDVKPECPPRVRRLDQSTLDEYAAMDKDIASVWGRKWVSTIGITAIAQLLASATGGVSESKSRGAHWIRQAVYFPIRAPLLALAGLILARIRGLAALSLFVNLVIIPRLSPSWRWVVTVATGILLIAGLSAWVAKRRTEGTDVSREQRWYLAGELASVAATVLGITFGVVMALDVAHWRSSSVYPDGLRALTASHSVPLPYAMAVIVGAGGALWLLWAWATHPRRLLCGTLAAVVMYGSAWLSLQTFTDQDLAGWESVAKAVGSMWWGVLLVALLTVTWAVVRRPVKIAIRKTEKQGANDC